MPAANDNFASATVLTGTSGSVFVAYDTANAGTETGEPSLSSGHTLWWSWTAPANGSVQVDTIGSSFDTLLGVYTGSAVNALTTIDTDDDGGSGSTSLITFTATSGTTYYFQVDSYSAPQTGSLHLNWALSAPLPAPTNDLFANATAISGTSGSDALAYNSTGAGTETGEPALGSGHTLWWKWTAPASGTVQIDTNGSALDTMLAVYTGSAVNSLTLLASDDDSGTGSNSLVNIAVSAGVTYRIQVDVYSAPASGTLRLQWALTTGPVGPPSISGLAWTAPAVVGETLVTVTGTNLTNIQAVTLGSHPGLDLLVLSSTSLRFRIPPDATSGDTVTVTDDVARTATSTATVTVYYPGPWQTPPPAVAVARASDGGHRGYDLGFGEVATSQPSFTGMDSGLTSAPPSVYFGVSGNSPLSPGPPDWLWLTGAVGLVIDATPSPTTMPPTTPGTLPPDAYAVQNEHPQGTATDDPTVQFSAVTTNGDYIDDNQPKTAGDVSADIFQPTVEFRRLGTASPPTTWPSPATLTALTLDLDDPVLETGGTTTVFSNGGVDNGLLFDNPTPADPWSSGVVLPFTGWDSTAGRLQRAWLVALSPLIDAPAITPPAMIPGGANDTLTGSGVCDKTVQALVDVRATWPYQPPRYRFLYPSPLATDVRVLRRRQQATSVGTAPRRRQISSRAGSPRRGPAAAR